MNSLRATLLVCLSALACNAGVIYSTFGPGDSYHPAYNSTLLWNNDSFDVAGEAFTSATSTTITRVRAALFLTAASSRQVNFGIVAGPAAPPNGLPSALGSFTLNEGTAIYAADTSFAVTAGTNYWLVLWADQVTSGGGTTAWMYSDPFAFGTHGYLGSPSGAWDVASGEIQGAFDLSDGPAVPEPSTAALLGLASAAGLVFARSRRGR